MIQNEAERQGWTDHGQRQKWALGLLKLQQEINGTLRQ